MEKKHGIFMILIIIAIVVSIFTGEYGFLGLLLLATVLVMIIAKIEVKIYDISMKKSELIIPIVTGVCFEIIILGQIFNTGIIGYLANFIGVIVGIFDVVILCKQPKNVLNCIKIIVDIIWLFLGGIELMPRDELNMVVYASDNVINYIPIHIYGIVIRVLINIIELVTGIIKEKKFMYSDYTYIDE